MPNVIRFEIETDAPYTSDEKAALLDDFQSFMEDADADVLTPTAKISIVDKSDENGSVISDEIKKQIIDEFVAGARIEFQVQGRFKDEDGKDVGDSVSATGFLV